jgi:CcmD family protein
MMANLAFLLTFVLQPPAGQNEFVPASSIPRTDQLQAAPLLIAAYAFVWIAACFYLWTIWRRLRKVEDEMLALERRSGQSGSPGAPRPLR